DLTPELVSAYGLEVIPYIVTLDGASYRDGVDIDRQRLFALVEEKGELPKTAAPSVAEFMEVFQGEEPVMYIGISSRLSSGIDHARLAAQAVGPERVRVVDSLNLSTGIGLLALLAAEARNEGLGLDEIEHRVSQAIPNVWTTFVVETMRYLYLGGRCTALQSIVGSLLHIRPAIQVLADGTMGLRAKLRGPRRKALDSLLSDLEANLPRLDRRRVFVTHSGCEEDAAYLASEVERIATPEEVLITGAGCVISSHCGPDTIGLLYLLR
ncbi:MAG: DegV family protein, partial [Chloroflexi bacterium]|nr:DegV family protein [Chloroflexota bacterium]